MTGHVMRSILLATVLGLAVLAVKSTVDVIDVSPIAHSGTSSVAMIAAPPKIAVPSLDDMKETRERPLFSTERRPVIESETAPPAVDLRGVVLIGLLHAEGRQGRALIRVEGTGSSQWVGTGGEVSGYVVREITPGGVILERNGQTLNLKIRPTRTALER